MTMNEMLVTMLKSEDKTGRIEVLSVYSDRFQAQDTADRFNANPDDGDIENGIRYFIETWCVK